MRLYYCKRLDQIYKTRQGVYVIAKNWTKRFSWVIFSRKIDALSASFAPSPLTLRGDKSLRDCDVRCLRSSKNLSGYAPLKWSRSNSRDAKTFAEPNSKLGEANVCKLDNIRRVFRKQRNEKWQNIWGMSAANFAMKNPHTHSKILGNQNAMPQKILT